MNILYFGTICSLEHYETLLNKCRKKPTVATIVFETALIDGFIKNGIEPEILSFPMVPNFSESRILSFGGYTERLSCGSECYWLRTINIPFLKQWSRKIDARRVLNHWCKKNQGEGVILTYSIPPFLVKDIVRFGRKYNIKTTAIVPDLPVNMYLNHKGNLILNLLRKSYLGISLRYQGEFDGYIYLTEAMSEQIAPGKPYIVIEGIWNNEFPTDCETKSIKSSKRAVMYAGQMHRKYGVIHLIDAFERVCVSDTELWLFGEGNAVSEILERAKINNNIRYFGRVCREEILKKEREATLLVNPRSVKDDFTRYSFPSKIIEYMYSGTPLLTTRLEGIPEEYFRHVFCAQDNTELELDQALRYALSMTDEELSQMGENARRFIITQKNSKVQGRRILEFICGESGDDYDKGKNTDV